MSLVIKSANRIHSVGNWLRCVYNWFGDLPQRLVTIAGKHRGMAVVVVVLCATVAGGTIIATAPTQPGRAEPVSPYLAMNAVTDDQARPPYPVRAPLPLPTDYIGLYQRVGTSSYKPLRRESHAADRLPKIAFYYSGWSQGFRTAFADDARKADAVPFVQLEPRDVSLAAIALGAYDSHLRAYADTVASYKGAVIIGFGQEMNERQYSWGYGQTSPAVFVRAWRHIVSIFRSQNADNVTWLWTIEESSTTVAPFHDWWPGASYVTWVGIDGYYEQSARAHTSEYDGTITRVRHITGDPVVLLGDGRSTP